MSRALAIVGGAFVVLFGALLVSIGVTDPYASAREASALIAGSALSVLGGLIAVVTDRRRGRAPHWRRSRASMG